jgi:hypothetical protein
MRHQGLGFLAGGGGTTGGTVGERYRYDTDPRHSRSELPVDEYNHGMAALRYLVMGLPRPKGRVQGEKTPTAEEKQAAEIQAPRRYLWNTPAVWWKV